MKYSSSKPSRNSYSDHQNNSFLDSGFGTNFLFALGQTQCSGRFNSSRQIAFTTSANVPTIGLETSHSSFRSSSSDHQYDKIPFKMVDELQSLRSRNAHSPPPPSPARPPPPPPPKFIFIQMPVITVGELIWNR